MRGKEGKDKGEFDANHAIAGEELTEDLEIMRGNRQSSYRQKKKMSASAREAFDEHLRPSTPLPDGELVLVGRAKRGQYSASCP